MDVRIDDLELIKRIDDSDSGLVKEIRVVRSISMDDRRAIVELKIPGAEGSILQDLGRRPVVIRFAGEIQGDDAKTTLENLRGKFKSGKPLPFSSDVTGVAEVTQILIEDLRIDDTVGASNRFAYSLTIREYIEPKEPEEEEPPDQDEDAEDQVDDETDDAEGSVNYITGKVVDDEGNPESSIKVTITDEDGNEYEETTNDVGVYKKDDLDPGKYTVTVDAEGYEGKKQEVEIKKSSGEGGKEGEGEEGGEEEGASEEEGGESEEKGDEGEKEEKSGEGEEGGGEEESTSEGEEKGAEEPEEETDGEKSEGTEEGKGAGEQDEGSTTAGEEDEKKDSGSGASDEGSSGEGEG